MKFKTLIFLLGMAVPANAAIYLPSNVVSGDGTADGLIQNLDNSLNSGGFVAMGYFTDAYSISNSDMAANIAAFTTVASVAIGGPSPSLSGGGSYAGYYEGAAVDTANITTGDPLLTRPFYMFVGNLATLASSTQWGILRIGTISNDVPFEQQYTAQPFGNLGSIAFGTLGTYTGNASGYGSSTYQTLQLAVAVPEPSTAVLAALGSLALLRRRRNG